MKKRQSRGRGVGLRRRAGGVKARQEVKVRRKGSGKKIKSRESGRAYRPSIKRVVKELRGRSGKRKSASCRKTHPGKRERETSELKGLEKHNYSLK